MPMLYRLWTKIRRPHIVAWERANVGPWDAAVKVSSALRAGVYSALCDEVTVRTGSDTLSTLFDMAKFYIDIMKLMGLADDQEYPMMIFNLGHPNANGAQRAQVLPP